MEVNANPNVAAAQRVVASPPKPRPAAVGGDSALFAGVQAMEQSLAATPAVRTEAVMRAQELIGDVKYPPIRAIDSIATLLAMKLNHIDV